MAAGTPQKAKTLERGVNTRRSLRLSAAAPTSPTSQNTQQTEQSPISTPIAAPITVVAQSTKPHSFQVQRVHKLRSSSAPPAKLQPQIDTTPNQIPSAGAGSKRPRNQSSSPSPPSCHTPNNSLRRGRRPVITPTVPIVSLRSSRFSQIKRSSPNPHPPLQSLFPPTAGIPPSSHVSAATPTPHSGPCTQTDSQPPLNLNLTSTHHIANTTPLPTPAVSPLTSSRRLFPASPSGFLSGTISAFSNLPFFISNALSRPLTSSSPRRDVLSRDPSTMPDPTNTALETPARVPTPSPTDDAMSDAPSANISQPLAVQINIPEFDLRSSTSSLSSPLSDLQSRSPTPPSYPSPTSTLSSLPSSSAQSPVPDMSLDQPAPEEPPAKKRRTSYEPKPRVTQHLNLNSDIVPSDQQDSLKRLLKAIHNRRKIVVVAGAGISVSAGIPDFRSSKGLFKSLKSEHKLKSSGKDLFDASVYGHADSTESFHQMVRKLAQMTKDAEATPFHHLLATLAQEGRLMRLYTQNVDGIDTRLQPLETMVPLGSKGPWPKTVQVHGGLQKMVCSKCGDLQDLEADLFDGPSAPPCERCKDIDNLRTEHAGKRSHGVGCLRPRMVLYNEHNPDDEAIGAVMTADLRARPDCLIVVGTTLKIPGVKKFIKQAANIAHGRRDGITVWINKEAPPPTKDYKWDLIVSGPCDTIAKHAAMPRWDEPKPDLLSEEEAQKKVAQATVEVLVPPTPRKPKPEADSLPTPISSRSTSLPPVPEEQKNKNPLSMLSNAKANAKTKRTKTNKTPKEPKPKAAAPKKPAQPKPRRTVKMVKKKTSKGPQTKTNPLNKLAFSVSKQEGLSTAAKEGADKDEVAKTIVESPKMPIVEVRIASPVRSQQLAQPDHSLPVEQRPLPAFAPILHMFEEANPKAEPSTKPPTDEASSPPFSPVTPSHPQMIPGQASSSPNRTISIGSLLN